MRYSTEHHIAPIRMAHSTLKPWGLARLFHSSESSSRAAVSASRGRASNPSPETQKGGAATVLDRLLFISGGRPVSRPRAPIAWTLGEPAERRMSRRALQDPASIGRIVRGDAQFGAIGHERSQARQGLVLNDAPLLVARLGPGIGKQD